MKNLVFWGATGQAIVLEELLRKSEYRLIALFDRNNLLKSPFEIPLFNDQSLFYGYLNEFNNVHFIAAIGGANGNSRLAVHNELKRNRLIPINAIHQKALIAEDVVVGEGSQIMMGAVLAARVKLGISVIINTRASIDHESTISDGSHIGPGVTLAGCVNIGKSSFVGTGSVIGPHVNIGSNTIIGAGSLVLTDIPDNVVAYGSPAKIIRNNTITT